QNTLELTEENFSSLLPEYLQKSSKIYFTPLHIAKTAAQWLTEDGKKHVLDIGAGVGKFCIAGASISDSSFYGVEYRPSLAKLANELIYHFNIKNAIVHNKDAAEIDFINFNAFYLYNPFYENFVFSERLNDEVPLSSLLYEYYSAQTENKLDKAKKGTRLVTYHGNNFEIPDSFKKIKETNDGFLKLWVRR
ncbi:MAG TPA: class I SAM-dependent methyltransferase, partial [Bacteroidia bacterium]|nr:class I SAM-dependent methyltransferase [Bacteroidia bacterium]